MKAFAAGVATTYAAIRALNKVAWSDSDVGKQARKHVLKAMDDEDLIRLEHEVRDEVVRRRLWGRHTSGGQ